VHLSPGVPVLLLTHKLKTPRPKFDLNIISKYLLQSTKIICFKRKKLKMLVVLKTVKDVIIYFDDDINNIFFRKMFFFHNLKLCKKKYFLNRSNSDIETAGATYALIGSHGIMIILLYRFSAATG